MGDPGQALAAGDQRRARGGRLQQRPDVVAVAGVVEDHEHRAGRQQVAESGRPFVHGVGDRRRWDAQLGQEHGHHGIRVDDRCVGVAGKIDMQHAVGEAGLAAARPVPHEHRLADARWAVQRHDIHRAVRQQRVQLCQQRVAAGEVRGDAWWARATRRRGGRGVAGHDVLDRTDELRGRWCRKVVPEAGGELAVEDRNLVRPVGGGHAPLQELRGGRRIPGPRQVLAARGQVLERQQARRPAGGSRPARRPG